MDDPKIVRAVSRSDFDIRRIKKDLMSIYLVIPPHKLTSNNRFFRAFIGLALSAITASYYRPKNNVLFLLDEFAQLGRMHAIEDAISLVRGYGAVFWFTIQDLSQLKFAYKEKWQTFVANTSKQFFGTADYDTAKYISDMIGNKTVFFEISSSASGNHVVFSEGSYGGSLNKNTGVYNNRASRPLMTPDEVMKFSKGVIVFITGEAPYLLEPIHYYQDEAYQGLFDKNPYI